MTNSNQQTPVQQAAISLLGLGFSVLPTNGYDHPEEPKKTTLQTWKPYQKKRIEADKVHGLFRNGCSLGIVCGKVSGNLECLDFDNPDLFKPFMDILEGVNQELAAKLIQRGTPSGGYHIVYRCVNPVEGNLKLAMSANKKETFIETRGEGGYFLTAPSPGYKLQKHSLKDIPTIAVEERGLLLNIARSFSEQQKPDPQKNDTPTATELRPGDDFNERNREEIPAMLESNGWTSGCVGPGGQHWIRPGKNKGTSATLKNGCFYVFSTNAYPFEPMECYSAFGVYACLVHGGDFSEAARDLAAKGYGEKLHGDSFSTIQTRKNEGFADIANGFLEPEPWELPISIDTPALPPITREMMPKTLGDMVFAVSANTETPPELAVVLALVTCATACQKKYVIESMHGHTEQLSLWGVAALESGNRKSSVEKKIVAPLRSWEADARKRLEPIIKEATAKHENETAVIKGLRNQLSKCAPDKRETIQNEILALEGELTEVPTLPQLWEQDITPEHLGTVMDANNECLGLFSSEGGIFDIISGRYSKGVPNLDLFLQSHSGDPVRVSRGSRPPVNLSEPALSIGISPQPSVIKGMADRPGFRDRGLSARFMYVLPTSPLGSRELINRPPVSDEVYVRYSDAIDRLLNEGYPEDGPIVIRMSDNAYQMWTEFSISVETDLRDGGRFEHIKDWAGKLPGLVARITGVYHCIEPDGATVSSRIMGMALGLADVLIPHALAAFDLMGADEGMSGARKIFNWICRKDLTEFSSRDCFEATKRTFKKVSVMEISLIVLKEHFIIRERPSEKRPGRPSIVLEVNPELKLKEPKCIRNIRKTPSKDPFCGYCEQFSGSEEKKSASNELPDSGELFPMESEEWEEV